MSLFVTKPGILTTVQDLGRTGSRSLGINTNGVMDRSAARLVNVLLGNDENEAVLELHFPAGEFVFEESCSIALGGAELGATLNNIYVPNWCTIRAKKGDQLKFAEPKGGNRCCLAVAGGFVVDKWLGSRSTNVMANAGGLSGRKLERDDRIGFARPRVVTEKRIGPSLIPRYSRFPTVRIVAGGEFDSLTAISETIFLSSGFTVSKDSNRMGFRLSGDTLHLLQPKEMVSAAVSFGTVQLLPDGQLIVLMADHQTAGGYPRIANVISADLPILAQLGTGDKVGFHLVSIEEAEDLAMRFERELAILRVAVRLKQ